MATVVPKVKLGSQGFKVSQQGLGCMGMSFSYGPPKPEKDMIDLIRYAVDDLGITFLDTADVYGPHTNEILIGKAIEGRREKVQLATKFANHFKDGEMVISGDPDYVQAACEASLKRLNVDYIDLYYQHRVDTSIPIEITVGAMKKLVEQGKVKYLGLSEACAADIRRAHAVHPITALQMEWSLWTRELEDEIVPTCRELGIGIVPYSPLGRGFFSGLDVASLPDGDARKKNFPRLLPENVENNRKFYERLVEIGKKHGSTPGQVALAWVQHQGPDVAPIPGTTRVNNLEENIKALDLKLSDEELKEIADAVPAEDVAGDRYVESQMKKISKFAMSPPLSSWKAEARMVNDRGDQVYSQD